MKTVWYITGALAAAALAVAAYRLLVPALSPAVPVPPAHTTSQLVDKMLMMLVDDPRVRLQTTQRVVNAVAARVEAGRMNSAEGYYALGLRLHYGENRVEAAEEAYNKAIAINPDWPLPHNSLGILLYTSGRKKDALKAFKKAMALDPKWSRPHSDLAILYRVDGKYDSAENEARTALKLDPDSAATNNNYGVLLDVRGRIKEAVRYYTRAAELDPTLPSPYYNLASVYARRKDTEQALVNLEKAVALDAIFQTELRDDPDFKALHGDPRFERIAGTPEPAAATDETDALPPEESTIVEDSVKQ